MAENTKEKILKAAFSFYREPLFREVSLSEIAERVGITKAAIFKHFKNKDALKAAMLNKMYGDVSVVLGEMQQKYNNFQSAEALPLVIKFVADNPEYSNYMLCSLEETTEDCFFFELKKYGITLLNGIYNDDGSIKNLHDYFRSVFVSTTMFVFTRIKQLFQETTGVCVDSTNFSEKLSLLIAKGIRGNDAPISLLRMTEIDSVCSESLSGLKKMDRVLLAIAKVISESGISSLTVDKVSKELGMAKSSLYTWFSNKNEMIKTLIKDEMSCLYSIMMANMKQMNCAGERLYAMLQTVISYLILRPELLDVCKWLHMSGVEFEEDTEREKEIIDFFRSQKILSELPDIGLGCNGENFFRFSAGWFFALPVMLLIHGRSHKFSREILQAAMKDMYFMVQFGMDGTT